MSGIMQISDIMFKLHQWITLLCILVFSICLIVFGILEGVRFHKYKDFSIDTCLVLNSKEHSTTCKTKYGETENQQVITCYFVKYTVSVDGKRTSFNGKKYRSTENTEYDIQTRYPVGSKQTCWYDEDTNKARWNDPNPHKWMPGVITFDILSGLYIVFLVIQ